MSDSFFYGGQAVMEGVMMRGKKSMAVACRAPNGEIVVWEDDLKPGPVLQRVRNLPFIRGAVVLWDTMILGTRSLMFSANISLQEELEEQVEDDEPVTFPWMTLVVLAVAGILSFLFIAPLLSNIVESAVDTEGWGTALEWATGGAVIILFLLLGAGVVRAHRSEQARIESGDVSEPEMLTGVLLWATVAGSMLFAVGLFFVVPVGLSRVLDHYISSHFLVNILEGVMRLGLLISYLVLIARTEDIRRVFAYHGAEHKTINAHEAGLRLDVANVRTRPLEHIRCGTGFLLLVVLISILVFATLGRPSLFWLIASRVLLVPVVAAIGYEVIRFGAAHAESTAMQMVLRPGLWLQRLTTREPEDEMLEVAIAAFDRVTLRDGLVIDSVQLGDVVEVNDMGQPLGVPDAAAAGADG